MFQWLPSEGLVINLRWLKKSMKCILECVLFCPMTNFSFINFVCLVVYFTTFIEQAHIQDLNHIQKDLYKELHCSTSWKVQTQQSYSCHLLPDYACSFAASFQVISKVTMQTAENSQWQHYKYTKSGIMYALVDHSLHLSSTRCSINPEKRQKTFKRVVLIPQAFALVKGQKWVYVACYVVWSARRIIFGFITIIQILPLRFICLIYAVALINRLLIIISSIGIEEWNN